MHRVYYKGPLELGNTVLLMDEEQHHLLHVLRIKQGDRVEVCNGIGTLASGEVVLQKKECLIVLDAVNEKQTERGDLFELWFSPVKQNERNEWLLEKVVEAGVDRIRIIHCERSIKTGFNKTRWEKIILSAFKQSKRLFLPELSGPYNLFDQSIRHTPGQVIGFGHCLADEEKTEVQDFFVRKQGTCFLIGPEGDFSPQEIKLLKEQKAIPVTLGASILRAETAGLYVTFARRMLLG